MKTCEMCGCTDNRACDGGCFWVFDRPALCSRCVLKAYADAAVSIGAVEDAAADLLLVAGTLSPDLGNDEFIAGDAPELPSIWQPGQP
jgi:hypothetical protein